MIIFGIKTTYTEKNVEIINIPVNNYDKVSVYVTISKSKNDNVTSSRGMLQLLLHSSYSKAITILSSKNPSMNLKFFIQFMTRIMYYFILFSHVMFFIERNGLFTFLLTINYHNLLNSFFCNILILDYYKECCNGH